MKKYYRRIKQIFFFLFLILRIIIMKGNLYRLLRQPKTIQPIKSHNNLEKLLDNRLHYLNRSFQQNLKIQQIYLDIIKKKKSIHAKEIKQYYGIFTNSKAESLMFEHQTIHNTENIELDLNNKEMVFAMKRLYCRLIEKIMIKISYYLINKNSFNLVYGHAIQLIKQCEILIRRLNHFKDFTYINETIAKIFQENQEFQEYIFNQLISRGYINSVDQFYRINGIDVEHRQVYQRNQVTQESDQSQSNEVDARTKFQAQYSGNNFQKTIINPRIKREVKSIYSRRISPLKGQRTGIMEVELKYQELIVNIDKLMFQNLIEEIPEERQEDKQEKTENVEKIETIQQQVLSKQEPQVSQIKPQLFQNNKKDQFTERARRSLIHFRTKKYTFKKQLEELQSLNKSQLHGQELTLKTIKSGSKISEKLIVFEQYKPGPNPKKYKSPYFSASFQNAIKSIDKINLTDKSSRLSIKRMSQHIIEFHKIGDDSIDSKTIMHMQPRGRHKQSIIQLLNIYKNKTLEKYIGQVQKEMFQSYFKKTQSQIFISSSSLQPSSDTQVSDIIDDSSIKRFSNIRNLPKESLFKPQPVLKYNQLQNLKQKFKQNFENSNLTEKQQKSELKENKIKNLKKSTAIFQNFRLTQKLSPNISRTTQYLNYSLKCSPQKQNLKLTSILTSKGIESARIQKVKKLQVIKNRTVNITPTQSPLLPHFSVYDRIRRMVIK